MTNKCYARLRVRVRDSTNTIFCNASYISNMKNAKYSLEIQTNGGTMTVIQTCKIPYLGTHWFHKDTILNIISLVDLTKQYRITMDTDIEKRMTMHINQQKVKFCQLPGGLYACNSKLNEKEK